MSDTNPKITDTINDYIQAAESFSIPTPGNDNASS
jgi:hypothetical protein